MKTFYNEIDSYCCDWLSNLMDAGLITSGKIDDRPIQQLSPDDVAGFDRVHFFAGIAGWDLALNLAGWPDDHPVWTGSCPCQPLSSAGQRQGHADERHLWPAFFRLISECAPSIVFGEQVASKDGREWLSAVRSDLETLGYACGAADLCAAGEGADHDRPRLWFLAHTDGLGWIERRERSETRARTQQGRPSCGADTGYFGGHATQWIADSFGTKRRFPRELKPYVDGLPNSVAALRAIGNSIFPPLAAQFIQAAMTINTGGASDDTKPGQTKT